MADAIALLRKFKQEKKQQETNAVMTENITMENEDQLFEPVPPHLFQPRPLPAKSIRDDHLNVMIFPNFVTGEEEQFLLKQTYHPQAKWQQVRNRRLQCFGGDPVPGATRVDLPEWLKALAALVEQTTNIDYAINHVLLNEYLNGQGILPHTDGPSYHPCVACLSVGDACGTMRFQRKLRSADIGKASADDLFTATLEARSLVIFCGLAYTDALHSIENVRDGKVRVSFTMRKILI